jgi:hypothetical protein
VKEGVMSKLDEVCRDLAQVAKELGYQSITVEVRTDGRVRIEPWPHWRAVRADVTPGSADPLPSVALASMAVPQ